MDQTSRSAGATIGVALLGVTAAGVAAFGLLASAIAFGAAELLGGSLGTAALAALLVVGILSLLFAAAAGMAARAVHAGRRSGAVIGIVLGAILVVGPAVASASGGGHPAIGAAVALGAGIIGSLAAALPSTARG